MLDHPVFTRRGGGGKPDLAARDFRKLRKNWSTVRAKPCNHWREWAMATGARQSSRPWAVLASTFLPPRRREQVTKSEFVDQVADRAGLSKKDASDAVDAVLDTIESALRRGSEVTFSGFGKFSVSHRSAREGRNPATGERIHIAASRVPKFSAGAGLKKAVKE
jgi:DNA-binding protein HU-beta